MGAVAMNLFVQWAVVCGIWWIALIDALGMYAGQDHYSGWLPFIWTTAGVLAFVHGAAIASLCRGRA
jgi:hypothetical protein